MDPNPNPNPNPSPTQVDHSVTSGPRYTISYEHGAIVPPNPCPYPYPYPYPYP